VRVGRRHAVEQRIGIAMGPRKEFCKAGAGRRGRQDDVGDLADRRDRRVGDGDHLGARFLGELRGALVETA